MILSIFYLFGCICYLYYLAYFSKTREIKLNFRKVSIRELEQGHEGKFTHPSCYNRKQRNLRYGPLDRSNVSTSSRLPAQEKATGYCTGTKD